MTRITPLRLPHLWIALPVHQVARLGDGREATSARKQLEEALKDVPEVVNGFWYTVDECKTLGFSDTLFAAMKDTTNNRGSTHSYKATSSARPIVQRLHQASGTFRSRPTSCSTGALRLSTRLNLACMCSSTRICLKRAELHEVGPMRSKRIDSDEVCCVGLTAMRYVV